VGGALPNGMRLSRRSGRASGNRNPNQHRTERLIPQLVALRLCLVSCISDHPEGPSSLGDKDEQQGRFAVGAFSRQPKLEPFRCLPNCQRGKQRKNIRKIIENIDLCPYGLRPSTERSIQASPAECWWPRGAVSYPGRERRRAGHSGAEAGAEALRA
jgi:hypothetical protein